MQIFCQNGYYTAHISTPNKTRLSFLSTATHSKHFPILHISYSSNSCSRKCSSQFLADGLNSVLCEFWPKKNTTEELSHFFALLHLQTSLKEQMLPTQKAWLSQLITKALHLLTLPPSFRFGWPTRLRDIPDSNTHAFLNLNAGFQAAFLSSL